MSVAVSKVDIYDEIKVNGIFCVGFFNHALMVVCTAFSSKEVQREQGVGKVMITRNLGCLILCALCSECNRYGFDSCSGTTFPISKLVSDYAALMREGRAGGSENTDKKDYLAINMFDVCWDSFTAQGFQNHDQTGNPVRKKSSPPLER